MLANYQVLNQQIYFLEAHLGTFQYADLDSRLRGNDSEMGLIGYGIT
jgi:hypothetical protein